MLKQEVLVWCDDGHQVKKAKRLDLGYGAGTNLCRLHWASEMEWRKLKNKKLRPSSRFDIIPFDMQN